MNIKFLKDVLIDKIEFQQVPSFLEKTIFEKFVIEWGNWVNSKYATNVTTTT